MKPDFALSFANIFRLGVKELYGLSTDPVLLFMIGFVFTIAVFSQSSGAKFEVNHASVGVVDEDQSELSRRLGDALLEPYFKPGRPIRADQIDPEMNSGRLTFVVEIPPKFEYDVLAGRKPTVQIDIDATAMSQAGNGAVYIQNIVTQEALSVLGRNEGVSAAPINLVPRVMFNPNLKSEWFNATMAVVQHITMLGIVLAGAALIREREHGTVEHLLVMPVRPAEIMLAKIWANGLVVIAAACVSLWFVVHELIGTPLAGSMPVFIAGLTVYEFSVAALGLMLATFAGTMGQFGLLFIPVVAILNLLSGSTTPTETIPVWLQNIMQFTPTPHFVSFAQTVLSRGAGLDIVWPQLLTLAAITLAYFCVSLLRFRTALSKFQ
ncbi:MAG TPA: ABC transporter permease [Alphaproteobacteria bacterium]|nr:ABC transporter permease [Alphaproteobacteria bacterium]